MTDSQKEQRRTAFAWSGGVCEVCGKPLVEGQPQGAHRIGNTKERALKRSYPSHINPLTKKVVIAGVEDLDTVPAGMLIEQLNTTLSILEDKKMFIENLNKGGSVGQIQPNSLIHGDCLDAMKYIESKSIDMILCDLPYGTTQNKWDSVIDLNKLWAEYTRIIKDNGAIALTSQGVFTARLILSNEEWFKYKIVWIKSKSTNFLNAKKQPLRKHEDICIFYKKQPTYNPQMTQGESYDKGIRKDQFTGSYGDFKPRHVKSDGQRYPNDVVFYEEDSFDDCVYFKTAESEGKVYHPTQKPVALLEYLIKTYTLKGETVLDNCMGSGSTGVACLNTNRQFIGIEKDDKYFEIAKKRIADAIKASETKLF